MSATPTTPVPAAPAAGRDRTMSLLRWITGGAALATILTIVTVAVWPASETDKAREDGKHLGQAVAQLQGAQSQADVDAALADIDTAVSDTRDHAGDALADQVADQGDALDRAVDGFVGTHTSGDAFEVDLYQAELDTAVDDLDSQAEDFRTQGPEVQQAFWDGYRDGLNGN
jgi:hypothetical protein